MRVALPYPVVEPTGALKAGLTVWKLREDFHLQLRTQMGVWDWFVKRGTETDFASIPRWMRMVINPVHPQLVVAALIHDELYRLSHQQASASNVNGVGVTASGNIDYVHSRFYADALLREMMILYGAPFWMHMLTYYGVRLGGWLYWED